MNNCILLFLQAHYQISRLEHVTYEKNA